ncbi:hypothetical protein pb186bvf_017416 [Paramecium bursaria]
MIINQYVRQQIQSLEQNIIFINKLPFTNLIQISQQFLISRDYFCYLIIIHSVVLQLSQTIKVHQQYQFDCIALIIPQRNEESSQHLFFQRNVKIKWLINYQILYSISAKVLDYSYEASIIEQEWKQLDQLKLSQVEKSNRKELQKIVKKRIIVYQQKRVILIILLNIFNQYMKFQYQQQQEIKNEEVKNEK